MKFFGIAFLIVGLLSLLIEGLFYGGVDSNGVLQESLFLPIGALCTVIGAVILLSIAVMVAIGKFRNILPYSKEK